MQFPVGGGIDLNQHLDAREKSCDRAVCRPPEKRKGSRFRPAWKVSCLLGTACKRDEQHAGWASGLQTTACWYQDRLLSDNDRQVATAIMVQWREVSLAQLREVAAHHPPSVDVDLERLADMLPALIDGSIIFSRVVGDQSVLPGQIRLYRSLIESTFKFDAC